MNTEDTISLSGKALDRMRGIEQYLSGVMTQVALARILDLSERHVRRLLRRYQKMGPQGLINRRYAHKPGNAIDDSIKSRSLALIKQNFYDYGPTLVAEKLAEYHQIKVSKETTRQWMIEAGLWKAHQRSEAKVHSPRQRRSHVGELIQIDGSYHKWFEDRGNKACLLVFIDDATSALMALRFTTAETSLDYIDTFKSYVQNHGVPRAFYFDKHNVFRVNQINKKEEERITQFGRVLNEMGVKPIYAHSP